MALGTYQYGDVTFDLDAMHDSSKRILIIRQAAHVLGNEVASKLKTLADKRIESGEADFTDEERDAKKAELQAAYIARWNDGTYANGMRAPRAVAGNRYDVLIEQKTVAAAKGYMKSALKDGRLVAVEGQDDAWMNRRGEVLNFEAIKERVFTQSQEEIEQEVDEQLAAEKRRAERKPSTQLDL